MKTLIALGLLVLALPAAATAMAVPSPVVAGSALQIAAEVIAFDAGTRRIRLLGPLGGVFDAVVAEGVEEIPALQPGVMVEVTFHNAFAVWVQRRGDGKPLFSGADAPASRPGARVPALAPQFETAQVFSVDTTANLVVLEGKDGTLRLVDVVHPELQERLHELETGDEIDLAVSLAVVTEIAPVAAGAMPMNPMRVGTLIVDRGEIVKRTNNVLLLRSERGRMVRLVVDGDAKVRVNGHEFAVDDLAEGTRLVRTAIRVTEVAYTP